MENTFATEDKRKDELFKAWNQHLRNIQFEMQGKVFEEFYEGLVDTIGFSKNSMGVQLENGRKIRDLPITPEISAYCSRLDTLFVELGLRKGQWWPLTVVSIGTVVNEAKGEIHFSINPLMVSPSVLSHAMREGEA